MSYCVGLLLQDGLVMLADTRTNAGVDNIAVFSKLHVFETPGERSMVLMTSGNLAISQSIINVLSEGIEDPATGHIATLANVPTMFAAARLVGQAIRQVHAIDAAALQEQGILFDVSVLLGGQIRGRTMRLFNIYAAGNFIEATPDTPFMQIGEVKYGKPILDRAATFDTPLSDGVKLALISMDSTMRSNLTVGLPIELAVLPRDAYQVSFRRRITEQDEGFQLIRESWSQALKIAYRNIPSPVWLADIPGPPSQPK
jgi:putative proteasome-type protease